MIDKKLKYNVLFNMIYQFLIVAIPLITTPYISRVLGADKIGEYSFAQSIVSYFVILATMGSTLYGQRCIAYSKHNQGGLRKNFSEIAILRFIMTILMVIMFIVIIMPHADNRALYLIASIEIIAVAFDISWFYQGIEDFKTIAICNGLFKILGTILIFNIVNDRNHLNRYVICFLGSTLLGHAITWLFVKKKICKKGDIHLKVNRHIVPTFKLFVSQLAIQIYTVLDKTMLGIITKSDFENGYYEQSLKIVKAVIALITSIGTVMSSRVAILWGEGKKKDAYSVMYESFHVLYVIAMPLTIGLGIAANRIVPIYLGTGYDKVVPLMQIFAWLIPVIGTSNILGIQFLIPTQRENLLSYSVLFGAIINFILNLILIPKYGALGAARASIIAELMVVIVQVLCLKKELIFKKIFFCFCRYFVLSIIMGIVGLFIDSLLVDGVVSLILLISICVLVYGFLLMVMGDSIFRLLLRNKE